MAETPQAVIVVRGGLTVKADTNTTVVKDTNS